MTRIHEITKLGQSIWYDNIRRALLESGELKSLVEQGVRGVTSNPTIFEKAIGGSNDYDHQFIQLVQEGKSVTEIFEALAIEDMPFLFIFPMFMTLVRVIQTPAVIPTL